MLIIDYQGMRMFRGESKLPFFGKDVEGGMADDISKGYLQAKLAGL